MSFLSTHDLLLLGISAICGLGAVAFSAWWVAGTVTMEDDE